MVHPAIGERGEVALRIGGRTHVLCLTMGALSALESAFGCEDLAALGARLGRLLAEDMETVLRALAGGEISCEGADWRAAAGACAECFRLAFAA